MTDEAIEARRGFLQPLDKQNRKGKTIGSVVGMISGTLGTSAELAEECRGQRVLDIGCGEGYFAKDLTALTDTTVISVDNDPEIIKKVPTEAGEVLVADGRSLPFDDESFDKVFSIASCFTYAQSPIDTISSFNEMLRVIKDGGSGFIIPAFIKFVDYCKLMRMEGHPRKQALALGMAALQDHILFNALQSLTKDDYISVTWAAMMWQPDGFDEDSTFDIATTIVDKKKSIPSSVFDEHLEYAESFYEKQASETEAC